MVNHDPALRILLANLLELATAHLVRLDPRAHQLSIERLRGSRIGQHLRQATRIARDIDDRIEVSRIVRQPRDLQIDQADDDLCRRHLGSQHLRPAHGHALEQTDGLAVLTAPPDHEGRRRARAAAQRSSARSGRRGSRTDRVARAATGPAAAVVLCSRLVFRSGAPVRVRRYARGTGTPYYKGVYRTVPAPAKPYRYEPGT